MTTSARSVFAPLTSTLQHLPYLWKDSGAPFFQTLPSSPASSSSSFCAAVRGKRDILQIQEAGADPSDSSAGQIFMGFQSSFFCNVKMKQGTFKTTFPVNVLCHLRLLHTYNFNVCESGQTAPIIFVPFHNPVFPSLCMPESSITEATKCSPNHQ